TMPGGLLLACAALHIRYPVLQHRAANVIPLVTYAVFAVAALLSWRFNRSRVLYTVVVLGIIYRVVIHHLPTGPATSGKVAVILDAVSLLLPLNLMAFTFFRERGTTTPLGILRLVLIGIQMVAVLVISRPVLADVAGFLRCYLVLCQS